MTMQKQKTLSLLVFFLSLLTVGCPSTNKDKDSSTGPDEATSSDSSDDTDKSSADSTEQTSQDDTTRSDTTDVDNDTGGSDENLEDSAVDTSTSSKDEGDSATVNSSSVHISINYKKGTDISPPIVYAIWVEDTDQKAVQNVYICGSLLDGSLTGTALPYWWMNKRPVSSKTALDAVTGATVQNSDFSVDAVVARPDSGRFTAYVEIDHSFDGNDWFSDQPALLYSVEVDLASGQNTYTLKPGGWTPNEGTDNVIDGAGKGELQKELRYITHKKTSGGDFGDPDPRTATNMVGSLTLTIQK